MEINKLLIAVLTKNNINHINSILINIEKYVQISYQKLNLKDYSVLFVDGNSNDNTYQICKNWCNREPEKRKIIQQLNTDILRPLLLEQARNMYLEYFQNDFKSGNYLLILDADDVNVNINEDGFLSNFDHKDWDFMGANQSKDYYDIWALRSDECDYDCWRKVRETKDISFVNRHHKNIPVNSPLIQVKSAFGGTGIYHTEKLKGLTYSSFTLDGLEQCEHVGLNLKLHSLGGKLYINPKFINV